MDMSQAQVGALNRIIREVEEKRKAGCIWIDCVVNHQIGGNDIDLVKDFINQK